MVEKTGKNTKKTFYLNPPVLQDDLRFTIYDLRFAIYGLWSIVIKKLRN